MKKINIAELLKDCPEGTKLYSPLCGECYFDRLNMGTIICKKQNTQEITFTSEGFYMLPVFDGCECLLFPSKENRDWSKFQRPFNNGDVIYTDNFIVILSHITEDGAVWYHCYYCINKKTFKAKRDCGIGNINYDEFRIATEAEKELLFKVIRNNGYKWNEKTKTLKKLIEPKFKVNDKVKHIYDKDNRVITITGMKEDYYYMTYFDNSKNDYQRERVSFAYQDKYELIPNQFDITSLKKVTQPKFKVGDVIQDIDTYKVKITAVNIEDECYEYESTIAKGIGVIMFSKQDEWKLVPDIKTKFGIASTPLEIKSNANCLTMKRVDETKPEPKFKKGDKLKHKVNTEWVCTIRRVEDRYYVDGHPTSYTILFDKQNEYELVPNKFDITTLKPFESKVLVRDTNKDKWKPSFWGFYDIDYAMNYPYECCGNSFAQCIPYEGNEHLCGKIDECDEFYKTWK